MEKAALLKAALLGAYVLMLGGYASLMLSGLVLFTYVCGHVTCILSTPEPGWEWECARQATQETLTYYWNSVCQFLFVK